MNNQFIYSFASNIKNDFYVFDFPEDTSKIFNIKVMAFDKSGLAR